ncbi:MAG: GTP-binding protein [Thiomicrorhabdus sp.]|nr:GTP-binding protein [Thiomicrorhabdus sp.]
MPQATALPVYLITGLLGSGKTTALKHLLSQKPDKERWGIIINEFGEVDIDRAILSLPTQNTDTEIRSVTGGCVCCSAQHGLKQAIDQLLKASHQKPLTRILIEPTGLGHPAKVIDTLIHYKFSTPLLLQPIVCIITPQQLTQDRWRRSAVMRDLVTLADTIVLNKTDLSSESQIQSALQLLNGLYPKKNNIIQTQYSKITLKTLLTPHNRPVFKILPPNHALKTHNTFKSQTIQSTLPDCVECIIQVHETTEELLSIGWRFSPKIQFNRTQLKPFFTDLNAILIRAKGILKTGNEWQLIQWSQHNHAPHLTFEDFAWRQDSRLELLFGENECLSKKQQRLKNIQHIETKLHACLSKKRHAEH